MYDTVKGAPRYWNPTTGVFSATTYITVPNSAGVTNLVNCYDQAHGVVTFGNLLGPSVNAIPRFTMPFGYINTTNLVGVGSCNNPFFNTKSQVMYVDYASHAGYNTCMPPTNRVCDVDDKTRTWFFNHMYVICEISGMNYVFDACAGQFDGDLSSTSYLKTAIDHSTAEEKDLSYYTSMILPNLFFRYGRMDEDFPVNFPIQ